MRKKCGKGEGLKFTDIVTSNSQGSTLVVLSKADPCLGSEAPTAFREWG